MLYRYIHIFEQTGIPCQLVYKVVGDGGFNNHRVSIHVPSFKNTPTVPVMLRGNTVADAGLIIASIDPCFSCLDR